VKGERLQKILARGGLASRRHAEELITAGRVRVNGRVVTGLGTRADPRHDRVEVDGKRVVAEGFLYVILHKPRGVVATMSDPEGRPTVSTLLENVGARVVPVGRLDFATSGALLATNDGLFANGLLHPKKAVPKTYIVKCAGRMETSDLDCWRDGLTLEDGKTLPAEVTFIRHEKGESGSGDKTWFELTIKEGRNQQIRRMGTASGFPVMRLSRTAFAGINTEGLRPGAFRYLTRQELITLKKAYGVPKSIPSDLPKEMEQPQYRPKTQRRSAAATSERSRAPRQETASSEAPSTTGRGGRRPTGGRRPDAQPGSEGVQPRYGMGSPGRRPADTREEYGGRSGRGSSGTRPGQSTPPPRGAVGGGRSSATRTTGSSGGIGGSTEGSYRMTKGRKR